MRPVHPSGEPISGALSWIRPVRSNADGFVETQLGNLPQTRGLTCLCRYVFFDSPTCPSPAPIAWSNGLVVTVQ